MGTGAADRPKAGLQPPDPSISAAIPTTDGGVRIIFDDGTTDDIAADLAGERVAACGPVTVIRNAENTGFPPVFNPRLPAARGEYARYRPSHPVARTDSPPVAGRGRRPTAMPTPRPPSTGQTEA
jgi:hypothetical protein